MKKKIFNYEGEEKEISLYSLKDIKSNTSSENNQNNQIKNNKPKVKFENTNIPKVTIINSQKTFADVEHQPYNPPEAFERRKKKFHTLLTKQSKIFESNKIKKKKRAKGKFKTVRLRDNKSKKEEEEYPEKDKNSKNRNESNQIEEQEEEKEEFEDKEVKTKLEVVLDKKFTPTQTMLSYCKCQLFISYDNMTGFQYTGLEGILCIMINRLLSNLYLQIYDIMDFKKQFEIELYTNILLNKGYEVMNPKFHTIEFPTFCLGINFYTIKKAEEIKNIILNYSKALNSSLFYQYEKKNHDTFKQKKLFDYISDPKKVLNYNDKKKKTITTKELNYPVDYNHMNNENNSNYFESILGNINKKLNYKISSNELMLSFCIDKEANEVIFDTSKGANRFLEQNNIEISDINDEYEKMKEKVKSNVKNNKFVTNKTKKSIQEDIKDKENKEKIIEIINQIEGLQINEKNILNNEEEKEKFKNKIKKFNVTKRLPINQKLQIDASPENLVYSGEDSNYEEGEEDIYEEDDEEGEEEEDEKEEKKINEEENNIIKNLLSNNNLNNNKDINKLNLNTGNNISEEDSNIQSDKSIKLELSGIVKKIDNSSDISSNSGNNLNNNKSNKQNGIEFSSLKNSEISEKSE